MTRRAMGADGAGRRDGWDAMEHAGFERHHRRSARRGDGASGQPTGGDGQVDDGGVEEKGGVLIGLSTRLEGRGTNGF